MDTENVEQSEKTLPIRFIVEQSEKTIDLDRALLAFQGKNIVIDKGAVNPAFKKKYADLADIQKKINPALSEVGIIYNYFTISETIIILVVKHVESQQYYKNIMELYPVSHTPQAIGSLITYAKRYSISAVLALVIDDEDDDGNAATGTQIPGESQQSPPPVNHPEKKVLNPDNKKEWAHQVLCLQNKKHGINEICSVFNITEVDKAMLIKEGKKAKTALKPGSDNWIKAVEFLSKEGNKLETITWKYSISEQDLSDLQTDVMNYQPTEANTTK